MIKSNEGELLACDQGMFRVVNGRRYFVSIKEEHAEQLRADAAADSKARLQETWRRG